MISVLTKVVAMEVMGKVRFWLIRFYHLCQLATFFATSNFSNNFSEKFSKSHAHEFILAQHLPRELNPAPKSLPIAA
jgi:hypothetical protein